MKRFIGILLILIISIALGVKIHQDPGYSLFAYKNWSVEMPLWLTLLGLFLFAIIFQWVTKSLGFIFHAKEHWEHWREKYRFKKTWQNTLQGLMELIEGHSRKAEDYFIQGVNKRGLPALNYLMAAKAAQLRGDLDKRDQHLAEAHQDKKHALPVGIFHAELQMEAKQYEQALAMLELLREKKPYHAEVLKHLSRLYLQFSDWNNLVKILPNMRLAKVATQEQLDELEQKAWSNYLRTQVSIENLKALWGEAPKRMQHNPIVLEAYIRAMHRLGEKAFGEKPIKDILKYSWDANLIRLFSEVDSENANNQLKQAEDWLKSHPDDADLLFALGNICKRLQLWGKAKDYYQYSIDLKPRAESYAALGNLLETINDSHAALEQYRAGLNLILKQ